MVAGDLPASFRYAAQGLVYGFRSQRNFRLHVLTGTLTFGLGLWLQLPPGQLAVLVLTVAAVLVLELLNTATEAVVDLAIGRRFHPLARIAKDCAAAAVLMKHQTKRTTPQATPFDRPWQSHRDTPARRGQHGSRPPSGPRTMARWPSRRRGRTV